VLGGLWHGAAWNFVAWGLFHAGLILLWRGARLLNISSNVRVAVKPLSALLAAVLIWAGWALFREADLAFIGENMFGESHDVRLAATLGATALLYSLPLWLHGLVDLPRFARPWTRVDVSWTVAVTALTLTSFIGILLLRADVSTEFIYFRF